MKAERARSPSEDVAVARLGAGDAPAFAALNALFVEAFDDPATYAAAPPPAAYLEARLADPDLVALTAQRGGELAGGLVAYVLRKCEQARSEIYIYDIATAAAHRRRGVATALIVALKPIARAAGAWTIYVQADLDDPPAIALYDRLGTRERVLHFDIPVD